MYSKYENNNNLYKNLFSTKHTLENTALTTHDR